MKPIRKIYLSLLATLLSSSLIAGDCSYELFSISSTKETKIIDFIEQLSDECDFSIVVTDPHAEEFLEKKLNKTNFNNLTLNEVLDIILKENNISYSYVNNLLRIAYLETRVFSIDYILSQRKSESNTNITLSSEGAGMGSQNSRNRSTSSDEEAGGGGAGKSGTKITSEDELDFWGALDEELKSVLNRPEDRYQAEAPIINKNAGLITVSATTRQMQRLEKYLKDLQDKVQLQVLIDVQLLSVNLNDNKQTGIDWSQLYKLQDIDMSFNLVGKKNVLDFTNEGGIISGMTDFGSMTKDAGANNGHIFQMSSKGNLNEVIKFLKTQGDVTSISNPKVLTLNNQPALISAGTEYFYKIMSESLSTAGTAGSLTTQNEDLQSVFAGVLLDITPEISDNDAITLKINPSLSETTSDMSIVLGQDRKMPPDLSRRQLSSVVKVHDGERIILGGLINTTNGLDVKKVPILGDIPVLDYFFKFENKTKNTHELVIIIEPHIISKDKKGLSLADLGYEELSNDLMDSASKAVKIMQEDKE